MRDTSRDPAPAERRGQALRPLVAAALIAGAALLAAGPGCNLINGLDDVTYLPGGGGTGGGGGDVPTGAGASTSAGGSGGTLTTSTGDCAVDDGKACTEDLCDGGPVHTPSRQGTPCSQDGGKVCDGDGACVGCNSDLDCEFPDFCAEALKTCLTAADCGDGEHNGTETDVDCGGGCAPQKKCADGLLCAVGADCQSGVCEDDGTGTLRCAEPECGDGVIQEGEQCDDGNDVEGDGCDGDCTMPVCGDGVVDPPEQCDDGDSDSADGCSSGCLVEAGFTCSGMPSTCTPYTQVLFTEVNPVISGARDLIELYVTAAGSTAGIKIVQKAASTDELAVLPDVQVAAGDVIVVHINGPGATGGAPASETLAKNQYPTASYGANYNSAWDFHGGTIGISSSGRVLEVQGPGGQVLDAFPLASPDNPAPGFPLALQALQAKGLWLPPDCGGQLCTNASNPTAIQVSVSWLGCDTAAFGPSVQRISLQNTMQKSDWQVFEPPSWGFVDP